MADKESPSPQKAGRFKDARSQPVALLDPEPCLLGASLHIMAVARKESRG